MCSSLKREFLPITKSIKTGALSFHPYFIDLCIAAPITQLKAHIALSLS